MRLLFRTMSFLATLMAFVMIVVDGTTVISAREFSYTTLGELLGRFLGPGSMERLLSGLVSNIHPFVARVVAVAIFAPPAAINLAIFAIICWMIGRRPSEPEAFERS